jgi:hypothetical protein
MPNGGISLLPEEMRKKEEEEFARKETTPKKRPELYVPGKQEGPKEPESIGGPTAGPPKPKPPTPPPPEPRKEPEEIVPFKQRPKQARPEPPKRKVPPPPKRSLRVSLIPEEIPEKKAINIKGRKIALAVIVVIEIIILGGGAMFLSTAIESKNTQINQIDQDIQAVQQQLAGLREEQKDLYIFEEKLNVIDDLLAGHIYTSKVFNFLEAHTLPDVWYESYISTSDGVVNLRAKTSDLKIAAKQIAHIEAQEEVGEVNVNNFQTNVNELGQIIDASFEMQIIFQDGFLLVTEE